MIHTTGPKYLSKYKDAADDALHICYRSTLELMVENKLQTIAFPIIALPNNSHPIVEGAHIALRKISSSSKTILAFKQQELSDDFSRNLVKASTPLFFVLKIMIVMFYMRRPCLCISLEMIMKKSFRLSSYQLT